VPSASKPGSVRCAFCEKSEAEWTDPKSLLDVKLGGFDFCSQECEDAWITRNTSHSYRPRPDTSRYVETDERDERGRIIFRRIP